MKKALAAAVALAITTTGYGQVANEFQRSSPRMIAYNNLPGDEKVEDVQQNFLNQAWRMGTVSFTGTAYRMHVPLIFDVYSNKLYFLKDSVIMDFSQPVKEFSIAVAGKQDTFELLYRSAYPVVHKNTAETFYEVLVDGKFQLLRCKAKTIGLYKDREVPEDERDYSKELLYAYLPEGKMILVKTDKEHLLKEMPDYAQTIQAICTAQKLKLKNETQLKELFIALNK